MARVFSFLFVFVASCCAATAKDSKLIGHQPPEWTVTNWIHSKPLRLEDLRGSVVLIRWWTAPDCPYCKASAPALQNLHKAYGARGLRVLGFYHHKGSDGLDARKVEAYADNLGFDFPVAIDYGWKTLNSWWLNSSNHKWTSVSFLLDKKGVVRYIHPGGEIPKAGNDYEQLRSKIEQLLAEK